MNETYFEILVYIRRQEQLNLRVENEAERVMADVPNYGNGYWDKQKQEEIQRHLYPVRFNEIVGAIEIHNVGTQLRADWWFSSKQRIVPGARSRGEISYVGKLLEIDYDRTEMVSFEIFDDFRKNLKQEIERNRRLKKRFIDFDAFDRCGPFVNWRAILGLNA